jgi:hypothetical protein
MELLEGHGTPGRRNAATAHAQAAQSV